MKQNVKRVEEGELERRMDRIRDEREGERER